MIPKTYRAVAGQTISNHPVDVIKLEMTAHGSLSAGCFWHVYDFAPKNGAAIPPDTTIPKYCWPAYAGVADYKEFKNGELHLQNGLYVCISENQGFKVLGTGNNKFNFLTAELVADDPMRNATGQDLGVEFQTPMTVWAGAAGPKKLIRVHAVNQESFPAWLQLFPNSPSGGQIPLAQWRLEATGDSAGRDTIDLRFGDGLSVKQLSGATAYQGCYLAGNNSSGAYDPPDGLAILTYAEYL